MSDIFLKIMELSIEASWLILAVILLRFCLKKAPRWIVCLLWGLVAIRLVVPFTIESSVSLVPNSGQITGQLTQRSEDAYFQTEIMTPAEGMAEVYPYGAQNTNPVSPVQMTVPEEHSAMETILLAVFKILSILWLPGVAVMFLYSAISYCRVYRRVRASVSLQDNILLCDGIDTPFILGFFRPRIYLPSQMRESYIGHVIAHEQAHIKRHDHWWKPIGFFILSVYWFNPLCWIAYILLCRDIELACDEQVVASMESDAKKTYAKALLCCSINQKLVTACPLAFGEVGVKQRIRGVLNYKKPAFWIITVSLVSCIVVAVCFLTNRREKEETPLPASETWQVPAAEEVKEIVLRFEGFPAFGGLQNAAGFENGEDGQDAEGIGTAEDGQNTAGTLTITDREQIDKFVALLENAQLSTEELAAEFPAADTPMVWFGLQGNNGILLDGNYYIDGDSQSIEIFANLLSEQGEYEGIYCLTAPREIRTLLLEWSEQADYSGNSGYPGQDARLGELLTDWAEAFVGRDGNTIAKMAYPDLIADLEDRELLSGQNGNYGFGWSSPWPMAVADGSKGYLLWDYDGSHAEIYYYAVTSEPHVTCWKETLEYVYTYDAADDQEIFTVTSEELKSFDQVSSYEEFYEALPLWIDGTMMDYTANGLGEALNENATSQVRAENALYTSLFTPEEAAATLLNLSDRAEDVQIRRHAEENSGLVELDITFLKTGENVLISMVQPYGELGIWVPQNYRVDVVSRFYHSDWNAIRNLPYREEELGWDYDGVICLGELPEQGIRMYGYNDDEVKGEGVAIDIKGNLNLYDWIYSSPRGITAKMYWDEEKQQLQNAFYVYTGTGVSAEILYVSQYYEDTGVLMPSELNVDEFSRLAQERIGFTFDENTREVVLYDTKTNEELWRVYALESDGLQADGQPSRGGAVTGIEAGCISDFTLGDTIEFNVQPGLVIDDSYGVMEYDHMPWITFELELTQAADGSITFELGRIGAVMDRTVEDISAEEIIARNLVAEYVCAVQNQDVQEYMNLFASEIKAEMQQHVDRNGEEGFFHDNEYMSPFSYGTLRTGEELAEFSGYQREREKYEDIMQYSVTMDICYEVVEGHNGVAKQTDDFLFVKENGEWKIYQISVAD